MATIRRRKGKWQARINFQGRQKAKSFTNKDHAKAWIAEQNRLIKNTPELENLMQGLTPLLQIQHLF